MSLINLPSVQLPEILTSKTYWQQAECFEKKNDFNIIDIILSPLL